MRALPVGAVIVVAIAGIAVLVAPSTRGGKAADCGEERWGVKTLTDPAADQVDFAHPVSTTVEKLRHLNIKGKQSDGKPPKNLSEDTPRTAPVETTVYKVDALLMSMRREDDKDMHLVIADPKIRGEHDRGGPPCDLHDRRRPGAAGRDARRIGRSEVGLFRPAQPQEPQGRHLAREGTLTGVGFFDVIHAQRGVATNGIELHPLLSFDASTCSRVSNP